MLVYTFGGDAMKHSTKAVLFGLWALVFSSGCGYGSDVPELESTLTRWNLWWLDFPDSEFLKYP